MRTANLFVLLALAACGGDPFTEAAMRPDAPPDAPGADALPGVDAGREDARLAEAGADHVELPDTAPPEEAAVDVSPPPEDAGCPMPASSWTCTYAGHSVQVTSPAEICEYYAGGTSPLQALASNMPACTCSATYTCACLDVAAMCGGRTPTCTDVPGGGPLVVCS